MATGVELDSDSSWNQRHPLLSTIVWLLGGFREASHRSIKSSLSTASTSNSPESSNSIQDGSSVVWNIHKHSGESLRLSETEISMSRASVHLLTPKVLMLGGDVISDKLAAEAEFKRTSTDAIENGGSSNSSSPSWGWYVSTSSTPQTSHAHGR